MLTKYLIYLFFRERGLLMIDLLFDLFVSFRTFLLFLLFMSSFVRWLHVWEDSSTLGGPMGLKGAI